MRPTSSRRAPLLLTALALAALTGCSTGQAGAAAIVGGERIGNDEIRSEIAEYEAALAGQGQEVADEQRPMLAGRVLSNRIAMTLFDRIAKDNGIDTGAQRTQEKLTELGGRDTLLAQGLAAPQIDDQVRLAVIGEELVERADPAEISVLAERARATMREDMAAQGAVAGLSGEELEREIQAALTRNEPVVRQQVVNDYLALSLAPYLRDVDIEVSPRYGEIDPATLTIVPGVGELSAPAVEPLPALPGGVGG
ncbi:SurA N-terminal domain-containing protein [Marinactinospora thermotolerans]|uniref:SurA N-terminal domain-containing protein n=1 Tax=Marinactinospora thermotolerans DSM 45154 TaxID=1122192 RepID=A0A1T4SYX2_9ACTN|nr:SurA N-terminal domain-containing protein [Marinactinospora thermotolerans]SKA33332.1 hypothetical protein SAMN02745673_04180 [Marinactinospora thermotolerans DSM 45154]